MPDAFEEFVVGDRVRRADADDPKSIPAYRDMAGTIVTTSPTGRLRVWWDCDRKAGHGPSDVHFSYLKKDTQ